MATICWKPNQQLYDDDSTSSDVERRLHIGGATGSVTDECFDHQAPRDEHCVVTALDD